MLDTVLHLFECLLCEDLILLRAHGVGHLHRVAHLNLLVPACLTHSLLALEGVEARNVERNRRRCNREGFIARVLRYRHVEG